MLFLKSTAAFVAPGVYAVDLAAKPPGTTFMLYVALDAVNPPTDLVEAILGLGFKQVLSKPYTHQDGKKILDLHFRKAGTDIFEGWTGAEREANLRELDEVLKRFQIKATPRLMTLAEAFG